MKGSLKKINNSTVGEKAILGQAVMSRNWVTAVAVCFENCTAGQVSSVHCMIKNYVMLSTRSGQVFIDPVPHLARKILAR